MPRSAFTPKAPSYFPKGVLKFAVSGHTLTKSGAYYICSEYQKGRCKDDQEKRISRENLEKSFSRLAGKLRIPEGDNEHALNNMMKDILHFQIDYIIDHADNNEDFDLALECVAEDLRMKKKRQLASDVREAKEAFFKYMKRNTMDVVSSMLVGSVITFAQLKATDTDLGRSLAFLSDEVLITNTGKIKKIKLNTIGSFMFQYIKRGFPSFGESIKTKLGCEPFERLDLKLLAKDLDAGKYEDMIPYDPFDTAYGITSLSRYFLGSMHGVKPENVLVALLVLENSALVSTALTYKRMLAGYS